MNIEEKCGEISIHDTLMHHAICYQVKISLKREVWSNLSNAVRNSNNISDSIWCSAFLFDKWGDVTDNLRSKLAAHMSSYEY